MAIDRERMLDIAGLEQRIGGLSNLGGFNFLGGGLPPVNIANILQQQGPQLGPDDFGSYTIPTSDPTYRSGFDYARSIAGGMPMSQVIAPGVSYSPEQPMGYTQEQLNTAVGTTPVEPPQKLPGPGEEGYGQGIGGVTIFDDVFDKKRMPPRDIFGANISSLIDLGKINKNLQYMSQKAKEAGITGTGGVDLTGESLRRVYDEGRGLFQNMGNTFKIDQDAIDRDVLGRPMISGLENRDLMDVDKLIPPKINDQIFIDDRPIIDERMINRGYGPGIMPPLPPMDIDKLIPPVDLPPINIMDLPPVNIPPVIEMPPMRGVGRPNQDRFSIQQLPRGLF